MQWLESNVPDYKKDKAYIALMQNGYDDSELICETASIIWLKCNRPDYQQIVEACQKEIRDELAKYKEILFPPPKYSHKAMHIR